MMMVILVALHQRLKITVVDDYDGNNNAGSISPSIADGYDTADTSPNIKAHA